MARGVYRYRLARRDRAPLGSSAIRPSASPPGIGPFIEARASPHSGPGGFLGDSSGCAVAGVCYGPAVPEIHGHRGARALAPENTLPGLACALAIGVDALEFDVTLAADGSLILAHDLVVDSATILDTGPASPGDPHFPYVGKRWSDLTLAQIATLDAGDRRPPSPFDNTFRAVPGTGVPTLDQVCRLIGESGALVTLSVELKTNPSWPGADVRRLTDSALATLAAHDLTGRARILGFDWRVLRAAQAADPAVPTVALVEPTTWVPGSTWLAGLDPVAYPDDKVADGQGGTGFVAGARDIGAAWLSPWESMTGARTVAAAHEAGLGVIAWTVNGPERMAELMRAGVDAIVSDRPDLLRQVAEGLGERVPAACALPWPGGIPGWAPQAAARR
jgi:glycerophosphoryl diester phosphodiesterase